MKNQSLLFLFLDGFLTMLQQREPQTQKGEKMVWEAGSRRWHCPDPPCSAQPIGGTSTSSGRANMKLIMSQMCLLGRSTLQRALGVRELSFTMNKALPSLRRKIKKKNSTAHCYPAKGSDYVPLHQECRIPAHKGLLKKTCLPFFAKMS